jgi:GT2 family glycosyltransferase
MQPKIYLLILNWNGWKDTLICLESAFRQSWPNLRVVVIDNGSHDDSVAQIQRWADGTVAASVPGDNTVPVAKPLPVITYDRSMAEQGGVTAQEEELAALNGQGLVLITSGANLGFAGGNNIGIRYACAAGADYIMLLNNDAMFRAADTLAVMAGFMEKTHHAGACGAMMFFPDGTPQQTYGNFPGVLRTLSYLFPLFKLLPRQWLKGRRSCVVPQQGLVKPFKIDWPSGASLMVRSAVIGDVGLMDEDYFLYMEETDWCFRMRAKGWQRYLVPTAEVIHAFGGSVGKAPLTMRRYNLDSQFTYYRKHFSAPALAVVAGGYLLRGVVSLIVWRSGAALLPDARRDEAQGNGDYWLAAVRRAGGVLRDMVAVNYTAGYRRVETGERL